MTAPRAYERLAAANPIPDAIRYVEDELGSVPIADLDVLLDSPEPVRPSQRARSRPAIAAVAFVAIMLVGVMAILLASRDSRPPVGDDPVEVVTTFFERWNDGDVGGALELVDPEATINVGFNSVAELRGLMEYAAQWDAEMEVVCASGDRAGQVVCDWAWTAASAAALRLDGANSRRFQVSMGRITSLVTPSYGAHESALSTFAREVDPDGFATSCDPEGAASVSGYGFAFDAECGRFLAALEQDFIAQLETGG